MSSYALTIGSVSPGKDLAAYINTVNTFPMLSAKREHELANRLIDNNDLDAARELVVSHLRFVVHLARSLRGYGLPEADLIQEGNIGLMKAVKRFDPAVGVRLVTFAVHWIKSEMHDYILRNWRIVKIATTKAQRKLFFNLRNRKKSLAWLNKAERLAIAADLGVKESDVAQMENRLVAYDVPLDLPDEDESQDSTRSNVLVLADENSDPATQVMEEMDSARRNEQLQAALTRLNDRDRDILLSRWLNEEKATLQELAKRHGVSAERVRQIETKAMEKIRSFLDPTLAFS